MTPRIDRPHVDFSWDGVENMIRTYDQEVILPRQTKQHEDNIKIQTEHTKELSEMRGAIRFAGWAIIALIGLIGAVVAIMEYNRAERKQSFFNSEIPTYTATEYSQAR